VSEGRERRPLVGAALVLACAVVTANVAVPDASAGKLTLVFVKGRVKSDGIVTPGQPETIAVSKMPRRTKLRVFVEPPPTTPQCGELYFCDSVRVFAVPGTAGYRSSGRGRATLSFVMPASYFIESDPFTHKGRREVSFAEGQSVHLDVEGTLRRKGKRLEGFGFSRAVVRLAPQ
jgi:hypothetical protein